MVDRGDDSGGSFLARWSRRKQAARRQEEAQVAAPDISDPDLPTAEGAPAAPEPHDLSALPSLEELGKDSDYTAFLKVGVPKAMKLAALRKAWVSDPAIAGFQNLNDYDWDFNAPGYGQLLPTDDVQKILRRLFRDMGPPPVPREPSERPQPVVAQEPETSPPPPAPPARLADASAAIAESGTVEFPPAAQVQTDRQPAADSETRLRRRRHGGAVPQ